MSWIQTYSGGTIDPLDPRPEDIRIEDIAHALSNLCRYTGHVRRYLSVAEHSVHASRLVDPRFALEALLHDASEAYLNDIATPVKSRLPGYKSLEDRLDSVIRAKFGLPSEMSPEVKEVDRRLLITEKNDLLPPMTWEGFESVVPFDLRLPCWYPLEARINFLERFNEITGSKVEIVEPIIGIEVYFDDYVPRRRVSPNGEEKPR